MTDPLRQHEIPASSALHLALLLHTAASRDASRSYTDRRDAQPIFADTASVISANRLISLRQISPKHPRSSAAGTISKPRYKTLPPSTNRGQLALRPPAFQKPWGKTYPCISASTLRRTRQPKKNRYSCMPQRRVIAERT